MSDTTLDKGAVDAVARLAELAHTPHVIDHAGMKWADRRLERLVADPSYPSPLAFRTLSALAAYCASDEGRRRVEFLHVVNPRMVGAFAALSGEDEDDRPLAAEAGFTGPAHQFGKYLDHEQFMVWLQTGFLPDAGSIAELRKFVAALRTNEEVGVADDGMSQAVTAKAGIAAVQRVQVTNPWKLAPYRTFAEVGLQPTSFYILRFRKQEGLDVPAVALFETGDNSWELEAMKLVKDKLEELGVTQPILA